MTGQLKLFAGPFVPTGHLNCNGQAVSRATYPELFAIIGVAFGAGDGTTTFNVPDIQGRVVIGTGGGFSHGTTGGAAAVTLTTAQIPAHRHLVQANGSDKDCNSPEDAYIAASSTLGSFATGLDGSDPMKEPMITLTGGGEAHPNMQPYLVAMTVIEC